ncbi:MAG: PH domain-containing protein [Hydrogenophaga sp.]|uniref:PH domain-containing protein n=1 Tax=Hydrogenophaga sp. TaxID=1904254 RepID=UPI001D7E7423|nr:PH domain-containing protein [Hydrogenophaga sp.]MBX3608862.1 PH domain-containing protein [Hydrogenophaga sp.]
MASYVEQVLTQDERVVHVGNVSLWSMSSLLLIGLLLLPLFGVGLLFWLTAWIRYKTTELAITNKRVIAKFGFISRRTVEININKVESIQVDQGVLGRIFDYGTLMVSGAGDPQAPIPGISNPIGFRKAFVEAQEQALARR